MTHFEAGAGGWKEGQGVGLILSRLGHTLMRVRNAQLPVSYMLGLAVEVKVRVRVGVRVVSWGVEG